MVKLRAAVARGALLATDAEPRSWSAGLIDDPSLRRFFADLIRELLNLLSKEHWLAMTQEPPLTARAGERIEGIWIHRVTALPGGWSMKVITQDIPDRGRGALEKVTGTDLYVGIEVTIDGRRKSKGFLVQAKWDGPMSPAEEERLAGQCRDMLAISDDAHVWSYGPEAIRVSPARTEAAVESDRRERSSRDVGDLFDKVLECVEGDVEIGLPDVPEPRAALREMIERVRAQRALGIFIDDQDGEGEP